MKAIVSVTGRDRTGIIAAVAGELARSNVNILDISQTIMGDNFVMIMHVDTSASELAIDKIGERLSAAVNGWGITVHVQHEDLFSHMHRV